MDDRANLKTAQIAIVPYSPEWPIVFALEAAKIRGALGENCRDVHHIGSTSVARLAAKPIIDIIAVIKKRENAIISLEAAGYRFKGEYNIPLRLFFDRKEGTPVHLHVYEQGHPEIELNLSFRNYLRTHEHVVQEYGSLKKTLLAQPAALEKNNSSFTGYTLGKYAFIQKILKKAGFNRLRMLQCAHPAEWEAARLFRQKYFFDKVPVPDPYTWTFTHSHHAPLVLYKGDDIKGYCHVQWWPQKRAALRIIVIDETRQRQGLGKEFLTMVENWLKTKGYKSLHTESSPAALSFFQALGYTAMPFNDPDGYESDPQDTPLGKIL